MPNIVEITDLSAPELAVYARLTQAQLRNRLEPEKGIFIAESPKVIARALDAGYTPLSLLMERKQITGPAADILTRCGDAPVYTADRETLASLTGFLRSSTADLSTTLTWALMTTALVWYNNIKNNGFFGWLKGFTEPVVVMTPMNIISEIAQPISMSFRHFVLGTVAIFIYVGVEVGIPNFMNLFLTSTPDAATPGIGMAAAAAGSLVGTYWFLMMCGRLIGGVIGGKVSSKAQLTAVSVVALVFVLLGIFAPIDTMGRMPVFTGTGFAMIEVPIGVMFLTLCGLCTSVMWGGIFNLAVEGLGKYTSMGSGIFMVMVCGGGILPLIQGYVADISNYLSSYWVIIAGLAYMLFYALVGSKNVNKDIPVED